MAPVGIRLDRISKRFDHTGEGRGLRRARGEPRRCGRGELLTLLGPVGLRQVDDACA